MKYRDIIYLIRYPFKTINSQLKRGIIGYLGDDNKIPEIDSVLNCMRATGLFTPNTISALSKHTNPEQVLAIIWCLDQAIPLSYEEYKSWYIISYDNLNLNIRDELSRLLNHLGEEQSIEKVLKVSRALSVSTAKSNQKENNNSYLSMNLSVIEKENIQNVLDCFEIEYSPSGISYRGEETKFEFP